MTIFKKGGHHQYCQFFAYLTAVLLLSGCGDFGGPPAQETQEARPYGAAPLPKSTINELKNLFPGSWNNPTRGTNPTSTQMRLLFRICGKERKVVQTVQFSDGPTTNNDRTATSFLDSSGQYIIGKDENQDPDKKEVTRFILYYDAKGDVYRGLSWTRNALGEDNPVHMVGKLEPGVGQAVIEWRPFNISVGVLTSSRLMLTDARNFTWEVRRIRDGEIVTRLSTKSTLLKAWP